MTRGRLSMKGKDQTTEVTGAANKRAACRSRTRIQSKRQGSQKKMHESQTTVV